MANTRKFVTELQELLDEQRVPPKKNNEAKSTARVLTSAESLAILIKKKKKKRKTKRKEEREKRGKRKKRKKEKG